MTNAQRLLTELLAVLKTKEVSDNGREFKPTFITSCRTAHIQKLEQLFKEIEQEVLEADLMDEFGQGGRKFNRDE